jgi:hypothetical protein
VHGADEVLADSGNGEDGDGVAHVLAMLEALHAQPANPSEGHAHAIDELHIKRGETKKSSLQASEQTSPMLL